MIVIQLWLCVLCRDCEQSWPRHIWTAAVHKETVWVCLPKLPAYSGCFKICASSWEVHGNGSDQFQNCQQEVVSWELIGCDSVAVFIYFPCASALGLALISCWSWSDRWKGCAISRYNDRDRFKFHNNNIQPLTSFTRHCAKTDHAESTHYGGTLQLYRISISRHCAQCVDSVCCYLGDRR